MLFLDAAEPTQQPESHIVLYSYTVSDIQVDSNSNHPLNQGDVLAWTPDGSNCSAVDMSNPAPHGGTLDASLTFSVTMSGEGLWHLCLKEDGVVHYLPHVNLTTARQHHFEHEP